MFLLFSATASAQIKRLIMAGSVGKLGEQQPWLGMTASPSGAKENNQKHRVAQAAAPSPRRRL